MGRAVLHLEGWLLRMKILILLSFCLVSLNLCKATATKQENRIVGEDRLEGSDYNAKQRGFCLRFPNSRRCKGEGTKRQKLNKNRELMQQRRQKKKKKKKKKTRKKKKKKKKKKK